MATDVKRRKQAGVLFVLLAAVLIGGSHVLDIDGLRGSGVAMGVIGVTFLIAGRRAGGRSGGGEI